MGADVIWHVVAVCIISIRRGVYTGTDPRGHGTLNLINKKRWPKNTFAILLSFWKNLMRIPTISMKNIFMTD